MLRVNSAVTAAEVIEGEAVMINLGDGMYFTMDGVGAELWLLIEQSASLLAIAGCLAERHGVDQGRVVDDLRGVADELVAAGLVVVDTDAETAEAFDVDWPEPRPTYVPPVLVTYSDLGDVLALDPPLPILGPTPET